VKDWKRMRRRNWRSCRSRTRTASRTYFAAKASKSCRESRQSARWTLIPDQIRLKKKKKKACKILPDSGQISPESSGVSLESLLRFAGITVEGYFGKKNKSKVY
jgi:hypothetical protein